MSKVFNQAISDIATTSGWDWDFVVDKYNHIYSKYGDVDMEQFAQGVINRDWKARGNGRFQYVLVDLCEGSGYTYTYLFNLLVDAVYDPDDESDWDYFVGVTMEHDW